MEIAVLLATYNGEKYLSIQLDSLINQSYKDFKIYISDDCSTDGTLEIINKYSLEYPDKIININNAKHFGNARDNFFNLITQVEADCYLFCDQDDYWEENKVEKLVETYNKLQNDEPILIHSDLYVVDKDLNIINESFFKMMQLSKDSNWKKLLVQNNVTGCTMLINKHLANYYKLHFNEISNENIVMHDYFFALIASLFGKIYFIDSPLIKYRQHGNNSVGAKDIKSVAYIKSKLFQLKYGQNLIRQTEIQAKEILKLFPQKRTEDDSYRIITIYSQLSKYSKIYRCFFLIRNGLLKNTITRKIYQFIAI